GNRRTPGPLMGCPKTHSPDGRGVMAVSPGLIVCTSANQSLHPSPMPRLCRANRALELAGPPVKRLEIPCVYSCEMIVPSKSASRNGVAVLNRPIAKVGDWPSGGVAMKALLIACGVPNCAIGLTGLFPFP